jgi:enamine deaminase RidA (YjgF/YER057c/UK114 family)
MSEDTSLVPKPSKGFPNIYSLQDPDCIGCEAKIEHIQSIKDALEEVCEENEALRTRVVELEAWVNKAADKLEKRDGQIQDLYSSIKDSSHNNAG